MQGRWRMDRQLHHGNMSDIWLLQSNTVSWNLVLKSATESEKSRWAMSREIFFLSQLRGEGIPFLYHNGSQGGVPWYVMPFYQGETLRERLERLSVLPESEAVRIGRRLCKILSVLHGAKRPVIYGDLKPENILITDSGGVYLLDYGNAWIVGEDQSQIGFRGTPGYAAPECWHLEKADVGVDIFALGVTLHQMLEGGRPEEHFGKYRLHDGAQKKRWQALIHACTALNAKKRIRDIREVDRRLYAISAM
ncbi:MAG: serine/threonine protein kinase [Lachnospiraceae bacterium]|nr:serine/threonine protein kinase [Lachnospiraceae bacterium]